jgi:regulator of replication initiation timing
VNYLDHRLQEVTTLMLTYKDAKAELDATRAELNEHIDENDELDRKVACLEPKLEEMEDKVTALALENSTLRSTLSEADRVVGAAFSMTKEVCEGIMMVTEFNASLDRFTAAMAAEALHAAAAAPEVIDLDSEDGEVAGYNYGIEEVEPPPYPPPSPEPVLPPSYMFTDSQFLEVRNVVQTILSYASEDYDINSLTVGAIWF